MCFGRRLFCSLEHFIRVGSNAGFYFILVKHRHTYVSVQRTRTTPTLSIGKFHIRTIYTLTHSRTALCDSEIRFFFVQFFCCCFSFFREKKKPTYLSVTGDCTERQPKYKRRFKNYYKSTYNSANERS